MADKMKPLWGVNEEGEINGCYRDLGYQGLWYIMGELKNHNFWVLIIHYSGCKGNLALCRFYSKHIALRESLPLNLLLKA